MGIKIIMTVKKTAIVISAHRVVYEVICAVAPSEVNILCNNDTSVFL